MILKWKCPSCGEVVDLEVEIESKIDYYLLEDECPSCFCDFPEELDCIVHQVVMDYFS